MSVQYREGTGPAVAALLSHWWVSSVRVTGSLCVFPQNLLFLSFSHQQHMGMLEAVSSLLST